MISPKDPLLVCSASPLLVSWRTGAKSMMAAPLWRTGQQRGVSARMPRVTRSSCDLAIIEPYLKKDSAQIRP